MTIQSQDTPSYRSITNAKVVSSNQIDDNVIADYDASGNVVGLEFLNSSTADQWEKFLALASQNGPTSAYVAKPPSAA
jgi:uncharacterized protein YuzE